MFTPKRLFILTCLISVWLAACAPAAPPSTPTLTNSPSPTLTHTPSPSPTLTPTQAPTETPTPTPSPTITPTPTPDFVWGHINVAQASCRYGPGQGYLLRTTLYMGDAVEVTGKMDRNENWWFLHTNARPDYNCWVSQELITLGGDRDRIYPIDSPHLVLPWTTQPYEPLKDVQASRNGNLVTVSWQTFEYLAGDDSLQNKYLVEVWICIDGQHIFRAYGTNNSSIEFQDERSCEEASHGRAFGSDKHGYTGWVPIPWPQ